MSLAFHHDVLVPDFRTMSMSLDVSPACLHSVCQLNGKLLYALSAVRLGDKEGVWLQRFLGTISKLVFLSLLKGYSDVVLVLGHSRVFSVVRHGSTACRLS